MVGNNNIVVKRLHQRTGKSEEYYRKLIQFIFSELRENLDHTDTGGIFLRGIGTWRLDTRAVKGSIYKTINDIRKFRQDNSTKSKNLLKASTERLEYLLKLRNILAEYHYKKWEYNETKYQNKVKKAKEYYKWLAEHTTSQEVSV